MIDTFIHSYFTSTSPFLPTYGGGDDDEADYMVVVVKTRDAVGASLVHLMLLVDCLLIYFL